MDYRNADGQPAEMCGNGVRVFVAYLLREGLAHLGDGEELAVATRAGTKLVRRDGDLLAVDLGPWRIVGGDAALADGGDARVLAAGLGGAVNGLSLDLGNPHTVVVLPGGGRAARARPAPGAGGRARAAERHERRVRRGRGRRPRRDARARARGGGDAVVRHRRRGGRAGRARLDGGGGRRRGRRVAGRRRRAARCACACWRRAASSWPGRPSWSPTARVELPTS